MYFFRICPFSSIFFSITTKSKIKHGWRKSLNFNQQKFSLRVLLSFCLIVCQFQPGVACKSVAYKKSVQSVQSSSKFSKNKLSKIQDKQKQSFADVLQKRCSSGLQAFQHRCFPVNIAKCLRTPFLIEHLWWLLPGKSISFLKKYLLL